jgi:hypothetical protein
LWLKQCGFAATFAVRLRLTAWKLINSAARLSLAAWFGRNGQRKGKAARPSAVGIISSSHG